MTELRAQLTSGQLHEVANALLILGLLRHADTTPQALRRATANHNTGMLRYSAIVALINVGDRAVVDDLLAFADEADPYYISIVDAIGSLCTPPDFPRVLPLLAHTNAGFSSTYHHFRELKSKEALSATISYLTAHPGTLEGHALDAYLEPIIDLIPTFWSDDVAGSIGLLLAALERERYFPQQAKLARKIITHVVNNDREHLVVQSLLTSLSRNGKRLLHIDHLIVPLITLPAAQWIKDYVPQYANDLFTWLPAGSARDLLDPRPPEMVRADERVQAHHVEQQRQEEQAITTTTAEHQHTLRTSRDIKAIINACERLPREHWPELSSDQRDWLADAVSQTLVALDLARSITWQSENQWAHPRGLNLLLHLTDYYHLRLYNDEPLVLALQSWPDEAISNYYRREGFSHAAQERLIHLFNHSQNQNVISHILTFLRQTCYSSPAISNILERFALDTKGAPHLRLEAVDRLAKLTAPTDIFLTLLTDREPAVRDHAFLHLVTQQHRGTIQRALAVLTDDDLRHGEVDIPRDTPLDWIAKINAPFAVRDLRDLRRRALLLRLWRVKSLLTSTLANIHKLRAAAIIEEQLPFTPSEWQQECRQEAQGLQRAARLEAIQRTPFDTIIRKLKGATSMIRLKVWCEGKHDRPIFQKLFSELGEIEIARTMGLVGGWPNLLAETQPERWLDGCRQAVIIMDGDQGRKLDKHGQPLTDQAKEVNRRFANHPLKLYVLYRYGIENYFPQHALESVLQRDLSQYLPIPPDKRIDEHFSDSQCGPFFQKHRNEEIAMYLTVADFQGTDIADILVEVKRRAEESRVF